MSKTTKETSEKNQKSNSKSTSSTKKSTSKTVAKKVATKSISKTTSNKSTINSTKKTTTKKVATKKASAVSKKTTSTKKTPTKKQAKSKQSNSINVLEYYDLPYRYNETTVKILAQTPKTLFVYWDISDSDKENYLKQYGSNFFENSKPVLIINNVTMNYTFEIEINDFANCWYFDINDEKCEYLVELGRRIKEESNIPIEVPNNYLCITSSNKIESPNGHILFEKNQNVIFYKNVKNNETFSKNITSIEFIQHIGKAYKIKNMYKKIYKNENLLNINNPSSH